MSDDRSNLMVMLNSTFRFEFTASPEPEEDYADEVASVETERPVSPLFCKAQPVFLTDSPVNAPMEVPAPDEVDMPESPPFHVSNGTIQFSGDCAACRSYCGAMCCKEYSVVHLSEREAQSGRYPYVEVLADCNCANCSLMRDLNLQYRLWKKEDGTCHFLTDEGYCSTHHNRPEACQLYTCKNTAFQIKP